MVADYLVGLALDAGKDKLKDKVDEQKLRSALQNYIEQHRKYNEVCTLAEEIDFQGLVEYIELNLLSSVNNRLFAPRKKDRGKARNNIVEAAIVYSKADTNQAKYRVAKCINDCFDIISEFYASKILEKECLLASEIVDAVEDNTQEIAEALTQTIFSRVDNLEENLVNASLFSIDKAVQLAETGNLSAIEAGVTKVLNHISLSHPVHPHYGYTYIGEKLQSKPLTKEARKLFPPRYVLTGTMRFGDTYYTNSDESPLNYAYRHQLPIIMEVSKAVKYLGDIPDPIQSEAEKLTGKEILALPPEFPPAFPCSIKVGDTVFFDYILLRTQEILDNGIYVISNKEQDIHFHFEVRINLNVPSRPDFTININHANNHEMLNYVNFMKALSEVKDIHIYVLEAGQDIIAGYIEDMEYKTGFTSVDEEIDFLERICVIEDYFKVKLNPSGDISKEEYDCVIYISNLVKKDEVITAWSEMTFTGILDQHFREGLIAMDSEFCMFSYVGTDKIELFGASLEFRLKRILKCAYIVDYEKVKKKAEILDDGESIKIIFRAGEDNSAIDTLNMPDEPLDH
ncbi:MAG: hypothetical protein NC319_02220 [Butyricicoccus sp.]|nr:hypothetical protein [Butyricicoccus sp.]